MMTYYSNYLKYIVPFVYIIPAFIAFYIGFILRKKSFQTTEGINYPKILYYLCIAEGIHNSYYFIATASRNINEKVYEAMMLPLPWVLVQGIIALTFLIFGFYFIRERDIQIGNIKRIEELAKKFRELAFVDPLTNLNNRRLLEETLEKEKIKAARNYRPFILMMFDIDGFKKYNDTYGHQKGDRLLISVADAIKTNLRGELDIPFRYGGDEFFVILPETIMDEARIIGERLNESIKTVSNAGLTLSIGLLEISPECRMKIDEMIRLADIMMYRAKQDGGNQIFCLTA